MKFLLFNIIITKSFKQKKIYEVTFVGEKGYCACPDFKYRHKKCKHIKEIEAAKLKEAEALRKPLW